MSEADVVLIINTPAKGGRSPYVRDGRTHDPVGETIPRTTSWSTAVSGDPGWEDYPDDSEAYED